MKLTLTAIKRPVLIVMCMLLAVMAGYISLQRNRVELQPDVSFGVLTITTIYPGAGPEETNQLITKRIEDAINGAPSLREITSSSQEGVSAVIAQFEIGTDMDVAINDVRSRIDGVLNELPQEAERPIIAKLDTASDPVLSMVVKSDTLSNRQLRDLADNTLRDRFARVSGVGNVIVSGGDLREFQVRLKRDALLRYGVGVLDVQRAIAAATLNVPAGRIQEPSREYTVRLLGEFNRVEDLQNVYLTLSDRQGGGPSRQVRLGDVATIVDANTERRSFSRLDGTDAVVLTVQKTREGNAVEISKAIRKGVNGEPALIDQIEKQYGVNFVVSLDTSVQIEESIHDLQITIGFGIFLVGLSIWLFLHNFRGTIIVAISIPVCLAATLFVLWITGNTLNNLSLLSLSLAVGVLVDDSIVVLENIYRHLRMGEEPEEAAINGRSEIGLAAIAITLADVVVFVPIAFMGGIVGQFFKPLAIGYVIAVMLSLLVSFTITPMLASRWYKKGEDWEHPTGWFAVRFERAFEAFAESYRRVLRFSLNHRWYFFGGGFVALFGLFQFIGGSFAPSVAGAAQGAASMVTIIMIIAAITFAANGFFRKMWRPSILLGGVGFSLFMVLAPVSGKLYEQWKGEAVFKFAFVPPSDSGSVRISIEMPPGTPIERTTEVVEQVEKIAIANPWAEYVLSDVGRRAGGFGASFTGTQYGVVNVTLYEREALLDKITFWVKHEEKMRPANVRDTTVAAQLTKAIGRIPGATISVTAADGFGFGKAIQLSFTSDDREALLATVTRVRDRLAQGAVKGVINPDLTTKPGRPELRAIPDRARLAAANISTQEIGGALRALYEGDTATKFRIRGLEYDIRVMMDLEDRNNPELLANVPVAFREGEPLFLKELARIEEGVGVDKIDRRDRAENISVETDLLPGYAAGTVQADIDALIEKEGLVAENVSYQALGQADAQAREGVFIVGAILTGLILVYMVLASLYNNYLYPLIVQLAQPQAMIGALLALVLTDKTLNIVGIIGVIAMIGLVGKNAILLVDYTNTLRERGLPRYDALVESGGTRLRPIMMTTLALVVGTLPVALAIGRGSEFRETIGIVIIGGTVLSTILTLLVIPCSYSVLDDVSNFFMRIRGKKPEFEN